jgi:hypothetical protein
MQPIFEVFTSILYPLHVSVYDHLHAGIYTSEINTTDNGSSIREHEHFTVMCGMRVKQGPSALLECGLLVVCWPADLSIALRVWIRMRGVDAGACILSAEPTERFAEDSQIIFLCFIVILYRRNVIGNNLWQLLWKKGLRVFYILLKKLR